MSCGCPGGRCHRTKSRAVEGWGDVAQRHWDGLSALDKAALLERYALHVERAGNTRAHLLAAASAIRQLAAKSNEAIP